MRSPRAWPRAQHPRKSCLPCSVNIPDSKAPSSQVVGLWKETPPKSSQALAGTGAGEGSRDTCPSTVNEQPWSRSLAPDLGPGRTVVFKGEKSVLGPLAPSSAAGDSPH